MIKKTKNFLAIITALMFISTVLVPFSLGVNESNIDGFEKGPSYKPVVPMKKITLVNFDEDTYLDDYSYLAGVPASVFDNGKNLFSNPLLFYQDEYFAKDEKERSFNARDGLDYFMEDWMKYCNGKLDQMTLINVPKSKIDSSWKAKEYKEIEANNSYEIASSLALFEWSYSNNAVIAVIEENCEKPEYKLSSEISGEISGDKKPIFETFETPQVDKLNPRYHSFNVPEGYKYIKVRTWWASICMGQSSDSDFPGGLKITIPTADPDSQFYCLHDGEWMQVSSTQAWNLDDGMDEEKTGMYAYTDGSWRARITDVPTFGIFDRLTSNFESYGSIKDIVTNILKGTTYKTDITILPGTQLEMPDLPPIGCRNANFKLKWDNEDVKLGMALIGPAGEELTSTCEKKADEDELHLNMLGECMEGKYYSIAVFKLDESEQDVDFTVEYSWEQNFSKEQADYLTSATEGAVLASTLNAPLLYISPSELHENTKDSLYKLGVEDIYLVDIGGHLSKETYNDLKKATSIEEHYKTSEEIFGSIIGQTGQNDIVITTIDPWTRWLVEERKPYDETEAALFIGPTAYIAAHHGSPVLITDSTPELSSAVMWHTEFWRRHGTGFPDPPGAPMMLTARQAYDYFEKIGIDQEGIESMITVADQYDIGAAWDRSFVGKAYPGRFFGSPVDVAYWISRNVFYPGLIFNNPAMDTSGTTLIQGSESERRDLLAWGTFGLKITKESREEEFNYPILHSYITYNHKLNQRFDKYYGFKYKCADDIYPGFSPSEYEIDEGVVPGSIGAVWPDFSTAEATPFYCEKGGFDNVFSTSYEAILNNLNKGVLLWSTGTHGSGGNSGGLLTWNPDKSPLGSVSKSNIFGFEKESNPWRGYDWYLGSTAEPDTMTMEVHGFLPALFGNPNMDGWFPMGADWAPSEKPILHTLTNLPIIKMLLSNKPWLQSGDYYKDGVIGAHTTSTNAFTEGELTGYSMDDDLDNIYSCGWILSACLPAYKYLHLTMVRHGSAFQVMDPWPTSWYAYWASTMSRDIVIGDTIGKAYSKGISHVGRLYVTDPAQWWWDALQNVCYFGDPDLRFFVPDTEYSDANYWEKDETQPIRYDKDMSIDGHMPFGATEYPNEKQPSLFNEYLFVVLSLIVIVVLIGAIHILRKRK